MNKEILSPVQEIKTVINLVQKPKPKKRVKKVCEPKNFYLCLKHSPLQENFALLCFASKEIALENKSIWDKKNKVCILVSTDEMNEFILSKK